MDTAFDPGLNEAEALPRLDVLIVGAGLSGIGQAKRLKDAHPDADFAILEQRQDLGGTWDLFRYPGIRSDSDMHTLGYSFKPWTAAKAIADGPSIKSYIDETAEENALRERIRFGHKVVAADWSSEDTAWRVTAEVTGPDGAPAGQAHFLAGFLAMCAGYYRYDAGHRPDFPNEDAFGGDIIHPQHWPEDLDHSGKRIVVIGSGATAVTLVPVLAETAADVVMLQRTPTWMVTRPSEDAIANTLRKILPEGTAYKATRWKNITLGSMFYNKTRNKPDAAREQVRKWLSKELDEATIDAHFTPDYAPWDQRLCLVPDSDMFEAIKDERARVVTGHIDRFTETGILLKDGTELEADIIVTATGLKMEILGGAQFSVDGRAFDWADTVSYRGMMFSGVPNLISTFGYINASWTLRADLVAEFALRLIGRLLKGGGSVTPEVASKDRDMELRDYIADFPAGYMKREMHRFPRQGSREPWLNPQDYRRERKEFPAADLEDGLVWRPAGAAVPETEAVGAAEAQGRGEPVAAE